MEEDLDFMNFLPDEDTALLEDHLEVSDQSEDSGSRRISPETVSIERNHGHSNKIEPSSKPVAKKASPRGRKKRLQGAPKRPLSAYNVFFQQERKKIYEESEERIAFDELGRTIGKRWRDLSHEDKRQYEAVAEKDSLRYQREMDLFTRERSQKLIELSQSTRESISREQGSYPAVNPRQEQGHILVGSGVRGEPAPGHREARPREEHLYDRSSSIAHVVSGRGFAHAREVTDSSAQGPLPRAFAHTTRKGMPISAQEQLRRYPEGSEIYMYDSNGYFRRYRVHYQCYRMPQEQANQYLKQLGRAPPLNPPPPPPGATPM